MPGWEYEDEDGVVHRQDDALAGEAMRGGPVILSWPDVAASADWDESRMNLVIHEFAHKIDMHDGDAERLSAAARRRGAARLAARDARRIRRFLRARRCGRGHGDRSVRGREPGEFFAVLSEVFFADPLLLRDEYPDVYAQFARFYRQDPAARAR